MRSQAAHTARAALDRIFFTIYTFFISVDYLAILLEKKGAMRSQAAHTARAASF